LASWVASLFLSSILGLSSGQLHDPSALFNELGYESGPSGLMARSNPSTVIPMEVLLEIDVVAPVLVTLKLGEPTVDGTISLFRAQKNSRQSARNLRCHLPERHLLP
jgi:hypothetical protein